MYSQGTIIIDKMKENKMEKFRKDTKNILKKNAFLMIVAFPLLLGGCNTMEGAGTDIQKAGRALEESAERNKGSSPPCPCCSSRTHSHKS